MITPQHGLLIVFEGIDGTGKSTQISLLESFLKDKGFQVTTTREPTQGPFGQRIRELYQNRQAVTLEQEHGVRSRWQGDEGRIKGAGVDGKLSFHDGLIDVSVKMGLLASMFEPVLKEEVTRFLDENVS